MFRQLEGKDDVWENVESCEKEENVEVLEEEDVLEEERDDVLEDVPPHTMQGNSEICVQV